MKILRFNEKNKDNVIAETVETLKQGGLVIAPSDTVYGVLVDAANETAVQKLIKFKNRPIGKSISVFLADFEMLKDHVLVSEQQEKILHQLLPGPFTVVLPSKHNVSELIESEKGTLGIRIVEYLFIKELINAFGKPTTATSANLAGKSPHHSVESLLNQLSDVKKELIDLVIDAGTLPRNKPSTVIDLTAPTVKILRQGDVNWKNEETFESSSESQTKKISQFILEKYILPHIQKKPVVVILKGDLGAGKTIFVKGAAEKIGVYNIISPTFTIYYEYKVENSPVKTIYHYDLYNVEDPDEFEHLGINEYLKPGNILFIEWGEKSGDILNELKKKSDIIQINILYLEQSKRELRIDSL